MYGISTDRLRIAFFDKRDQYIIMYLILLTVPDSCHKKVNEGGSVAEWFGRRTLNLEVVGLSPTLTT